MTSSHSNAHKTILGGSLWITVSEIIGGISSLASSIIAARVLAPEDFGLMGIVLITISILEALSKTGFEQALIQRSDDIDSLLNVAWTWHLGRGLLLGACVLVASPFLAEWYGEPTLFPLLAISASYIVLKGMQNIGIVFFSRELNFKKIFFINTSRAFMTLGVSIPALLILRNVWALLVGFLAGALIELIISFVAHPYRPSLEWNWPKAKSLIRFGKWITGLSAVGFVSTEGDDIFVSKYLGPTVLGFYRLAYDVSNWPATQVTHVISKVSFPTYARLQHDLEALRAAFLGVMRATLLLSSTVTILIWFMIPHLVHLIIGDKWSAVIPLVRVLVFAGLVRSLVALGGALFQASNRPDLDFKMNMPRMLVVVGLIWPFSATWGLIGACFVVLIAISSTLPIWFFGLHKILKVSMREIFRVNGLALVSSAVLVGVLWLLQGVTGAGWAGFLIDLFGGVAIWLALMWLIGRVTPLKFFAEIQKVQAMLKSK